MVMWNRKMIFFLDNLHVVPDNQYLLLKYQAYLNVEWYNQCTSIKYLFKYINDGYDCITTIIIPTQSEYWSQTQCVDEVK